LPLRGLQHRRLEEDMCDYSLEAYTSRPAREGERYVTTRFQSGTIGLTANDQPNTAVCLACDTTLSVDGIPERIRKLHHLKDRENGVFTRIEGSAHRDGIVFDGGVTLTLQELGPGCGISVKTLLEKAYTPQPQRQEREHAFF
jgi:hypothetical protein